MMGGLAGFWTDGAVFLGSSPCLAGSGLESENRGRGRHEEAGSWTGRPQVTRCLHRGEPIWRRPVHSARVQAIASRTS